MTARPIHHRDRAHRAVGLMAAIGTLPTWYALALAFWYMDVVMMGLAVLAVFILGGLYGVLYVADAERRSWNQDDLGGLAKGWVGRCLS